MINKDNFLLGPQDAYKHILNNIISGTTGVRDSEAKGAEFSQKFSADQFNATDSTGLG